MQHGLRALLRDDTEGDDLIICKQNIFSSLTPAVCYQMGCELLPSAEPVELVRVSSV